MKIKKNVAISDSGFIFNPDTGESFSVNPIGLEMLEMLRNGREYEEIRKDILDKYKSDKDTVEKDYHDFITMLKQYNLIENDGQKDD
ncbi:MAG: PqqD family protein [Bacteroidales bacterium]|nr:PqqD family protein [Bacteroidales bacterium]